MSSKPGTAKSSSPQATTTPAKVSPPKSEVKQGSPAAKPSVSPPKGQQAPPAPAPAPPAKAKAPEPQKPKAPEPTKAPEPPKAKVPEPPKVKAPEPQKPKAPEPAPAKKPTSSSKIPEPPKKSGFDSKHYATNGVTEEEVTVAKIAFDLFDTDQGGSVDIKGTFLLI